MWRMLGGVAVGVVVVGAVVIVLQGLGSSLYPLPEGVDPMDPADRDAFAAYVATMPVLAWLLAMVSELLGAFAGAVTGGWAARDRKGWVPGVVVALALTGSVVNWTSFAHPVWFIVGQVMGYPLVFLAARGAVRRLRPTP